jgi:hypothetical protein
MGGFDKNKFVSDLIKRTKINYNLIYSLKDEKDDKGNQKVYEVTQLLNSLFSSIVFPFESFNKYVFIDQKKERFLPKDKKEKLEYKRKKFKEYCESSEKFREYKKEIQYLIETCIAEKRYYDNYDEKTYPLNESDELTFQQTFTFIKHIRNALSHSGNKCLHFKTIYIDEKEIISDIIFCDKCSEYSFLIKLGVSEVIKISSIIQMLFVDLECNNKLDKDDVKYT